MRRYFNITGLGRYSAIKNRSVLSIIIAMLFLFSFFIPLQGIRAANADFLIPGISFEEINFGSGAKVQYLIISEVYEVKDTSVVTFSVLDSLGDKTVLEITSSPWPQTPREMIVIRVIMSDGVWNLDSLNNIYSVLEKVIIKEGESPFREATAKEIRGFELDKLFIHPGEFQNKELPPGRLKTPAGEFRCELKEFYGEWKRKINLGGNEATRFEEERNVLWISGKVPFWGLVQSEVTRKTYTKMYSPHILKGMLNSKETFIRAILISYTESCK